MKLSVLMDNNTYIDQYYLGEPAASYYIETGDIRLLFDTGYSNAFMANAVKMGVDLGKLTHIVLSHGHNDHTGGLKYLKDELELSEVSLVCHPDCFVKKKIDGAEIGTPVELNEIKKECNIKFSRQVLWLNENCVFLGEIPVSHDFEQRREIGYKKEITEWRPDYVIEDSAVVIRTKEGLFIVTGCSHSGICNIIEYAMRVFDEQRIAGVIGGFHLFEADERLGRTICYLKETGVKQLYPCHCVSFKAKAEMSRSLCIEEVGVGLTIKCEEVDG